MTKILVFSELLHPQGGGSELALHLLLKNLLLKGDYKISIITTNSSKQYDNMYQRLKIINIPTSLYRHDIFISTLLTYRHIITKEIKSSDIIYIAHNWFPAIPLSKNLKKPVVLHVHDNMLLCPLATRYDIMNKRECTSRNLSRCMRCASILGQILKLPIYIKILSLCLSPMFKVPDSWLKMIDKIIFPSEYQLKVSIRRIPKIANKSIVIHNLLPNLHYVEIKGTDIGFLGGNNYLKGYGVLLSAIKRMKLKGIKIRIAGANHRLSLSNILYVGKLRHASVQFYEFYKKIKIIVNPTLLPEPHPYTVVEALQMGRLLIASRRGGIPELVKGAKGVILIEPRPEKLAEALEILSSIDKETATHIGLYNRELVFTKFDNQKIIRKFMNVIDSLA